MSKEERSFLMNTISTISREDLIKAGYTHRQAQHLINEAKKNLLLKGFLVYSNKKLLRVPTLEVEKILGFEIEK
jgi:hypothetical protein